MKWLETRGAPGLTPQTYLINTRKCSRRRPRSTMAFAAILASTTAWLVATRPPPRAATVAMAAAGADDPTAQLFAWVESQGGSANNVVACQTPFGLGLLAARPMKKGDAAVRVPESCLLSVLPEAAAPALATLQAEVPADFWAARLGLALLAERAKGEGSRVSEYVTTLPAAFTAPLFWSPEAVGLLAYPTARARLLKTAKFVASFGKEQLASDAAAEAFGGVTVGADALGWAVAACSSRAYAVSGGARVLCPIVDLGNHAPKGEASCEVRGTAGTQPETPVPLANPHAYTSPLTRCAARPAARSSSSPCAPSPRERR